MSVIARVRLYIYIIPNKWEAIARVLLQLLCLDAESSFGRCLAQCQGKQREGCCHFCGLFICGLVKSAAHGLCLCINWCTFCYWSPSWSCKLSVSKKQQPCLFLQVNEMLWNADSTILAIWLEDLKVENSNPNTYGESTPWGSGS